jgi:hypothetical protein
MRVRVFCGCVLSQRASSVLQPVVVPAPQGSASSKQLQLLDSSGTGNVTVSLSLACVTSLY